MASEEWMGDGEMETGEAGEGELNCWHDGMDATNLNW